MSSLHRPPLRLVLALAWTAPSLLAQITPNPGVPIVRPLPINKGLSINEIQFDPVGQDGGNEWIELHNTTAATTINLTAYTLSIFSQPNAGAVAIRAAAPSMPANDLAATRFDLAIIGAGPAGLMAAEVLSAAGLDVTVYDRMPSIARKLLIAGRGGLNLTHTEPMGKFQTRYGAAAERLAPMLDAFPPQALIAWAEGLGQPTFVGTSGRVFPKSLKASPLLRAWLARLKEQGVTIKMRHDWRGWNERGELVFAHDGATTRVAAGATILALGGASWPRLGSNGAWVDILTKRGVAVTPLRPANSGFTVAWSEPFRTRFEGTPLKSIALTFKDTTVRGEAMITRYGVEGGAIYVLSAALREATAAQGSATLYIDLRPEIAHDDLAAKLDRPRGGDTQSNFLRKAISLAPVAVNLLREAYGATLATDAQTLARQVKSVPLVLTGTQGLDRAISTAGGIALDALDDDLMLHALPNVYAAGEMLDWEAPTGGYLLQATFATAVTAARAVARRWSGYRAATCWCWRARGESSRSARTTGCLRGNSGLVTARSCSA